jgi:hypothetical protein
MVEEPTAPDGETQEAETSEPIAFASFLEGTPPNSTEKITKLATMAPTAGGWYWRLNTSDVRLHCTGENCNGTRFFRYQGKEVGLSKSGWRFLYLTYKCSNCQEATKTFALAARMDEGADSGDGDAYKVGEVPPFGPPVPSRLISLIGPDRDLFLRGRRCEDQGLGIGAFVYYRRVVTNQKDRILGRVVKVAEKLSAPPEMTDALRKAQKETQFIKALESVKDAIPQALLINGQNPFRLLHSALSDGLHDKSDERCLEIAHDVRVVLGDLSDRLAQALKDEEELNKAVARLMQSKS